MTERLKMLRKALGFSQSEMANEIGLSQPTYCQYESGKRVFQDRYFETLKLKFSVNPDWLKTGEGDMFLKSERDENMKKMFDSLSDENKDFVLEFMRKLVEG